MAKRRVTKAQMQTICERIADGTSLIFSGGADFTAAFDSTFTTLTVSAGAGANPLQTVNFGVASQTIPTFS